MTDYDRLEAAAIVDDAVAALATLVGGDCPRLADKLTVAERTAIRDALSVLIPLLDDDTELPPCPGCGDTSDGFFACCDVAS